MFSKTFRRSVGTPISQRNNAAHARALRGDRKRRGRLDRLADGPLRDCAAQRRKDSANGGLWLGLDARPAETRPECDFKKANSVAHVAYGEHSAQLRLNRPLSVGWPIEYSRIPKCRGRNGGTLVQGRGRKAEARRRRRVPRRGHPGRDQGAAAVRRVLCRGLSGRADLAPDGRAGRRQRNPGRPRRPLRELGERGDRRRHPRRFGELSAARRGHLQVHGRHQRRLRRAGQSRLGRRHRRRAGHHRRGLRRRLLDHAGARARVRDEIADVAARPAAEPAVDRARRWKPASSCRRRRTRR